MSTLAKKVKVYQLSAIVSIKVSASVKKPIKALEYLTIDTNGCVKRSTRKHAKFRAISNQDETNNTVQVAI